MKKILFFIPVLLLSFFSLAGPLLFAQQIPTDCYKPYYTKYNDNIYTHTVIAPGGGSIKTWLWVNERSYLEVETGKMGKWACNSKGDFLTTTTGTLPACLLKLQAEKTPEFITTTDPNQFHVNFSNSGNLTLYLNNRYIVDATRKTGNWSCGSDGSVYIGAATGGSTTNTSNNTPNNNTNTPNTNTGVPDQNQNTNNGVPNTTATDQTSTQPTDDGVLKIKLNNPLCSNPDDPTKKCTSDIQSAIQLFMDAVVKIAIPFIVVFFIWSGLQFILARGKPEKIATARKMFWYTIIGTLLILGAWAITDAIVGTINSIAS